MIAFEDIDQALEKIGKNRAWLVIESGRSENSVRAALAPNAHPSKRSGLLQKALTDAIEREQAAAAAASGNATINGVFNISQTAEQAHCTDLVSRAVNAPSIADFCLQAIRHRADEILNNGIDPCAQTAPLSLVAETREPGTAGDGTKKS